MQTEKSILPPAGYPAQAVPDTYSASPFAADYEARRAEFLAFVGRNPAPDSRTMAVTYEVARIAAGGAPHEGVILDACDFVDARIDCADFALHGLLRLLYQFPDAISPELCARVRRTVLGFKYWPDEPGVDDLCTWTENHQILYASAAYLAGQLFPDEVFTNAGNSGHQKMAIARPRINRWLDLRFRSGFSEWLSNVYYDEDLVALLSLVDFAEDIELRQRAAMVIDLLLLDIAVNSFRGLFGSTHGRTYERNKKWVRHEATTDAAKLLFGVGVFSACENMCAVGFALSPNYRMPRVLYAIANDTAVNLNYQRMGMKIVEAERWGLGFKSLEHGMVFLSLEAYFHPRTVNLTLRMLDAFHWWENQFLKDFAAYRPLLIALRRLGLLPILAHLVKRDVCRNTREEVKIITYRTKHYMLSSAVDYRRGYGGDQQHIWQATLGPDAVCFTSHPARREGRSPNYWTGEGSLPRVAQVKNVVIAVYKINTMPGLYVTHRLHFTHAWLPQDKFDEIIEQAGWIFARKGEGYLALHSQRSYHWRTEPGEDQDREIVADGKSNVWICELGSLPENGDFSQFVDRICAAPLRFKGLSVDYVSPTQGRLQFGWRGSLRHQGKPVSLKDFPRYDNPYAQAAFPAEHVDVHHEGQWLRLDWSVGTRQASAFV